MGVSPRAVTHRLCGARHAAGRPGLGCIARSPSAATLATKRDRAGRVTYLAGLHLASHVHASVDRTASPKILFGFGEFVFNQLQRAGPDLLALRRDSGSASRR